MIIVNALCRLSGDHSFVEGLKPTEIYDCAVNRDARMPLADHSIPTNASYATRVVGSSSRVPIILSDVGSNQIANAVISPVPVEMVDMIGLLTVNDFPCDSMRIELLIVDISAKIPVAIRRGERRLSCELHVPASGLLWISEQIRRSILPNK